MIVIPLLNPGLMDLILIPSPKKRIDYIFVKRFDVISFNHLINKTANGLWVYDHLAVEPKAMLK